jgi:acyl-CoA thioesterase YciA
VGSVVSCYAEILEVGRSSMHINIEVWISNSLTQAAQRKVAEGLFIFVAIDNNGRTRRIK